jgi:solute carrier family 30 (zinc transporter), member 5/7
MFVGFAVFGKPLVGDGWFEVVGWLLGWWMIRGILYSDPKNLFQLSSSTGNVSLRDRHEDLNFVARLQSWIKNAKVVLKTILENQESKKIFGFLVLNLAFMFVQMIWGIWTNSLGLISDCELLISVPSSVASCQHILLAIHMFFDCLALAMGLFASVISTWPANSTFTYG